jgi:hypothetical protein
MRTLLRPFADVMSVVAGGGWEGKPALETFDHPFVKDVLRLSWQAFHDTMVGKDAAKTIRDPSTPEGARLEYPPAGPLPSLAILAHILAKVC